MFFKIVSRGLPCLPRLLPLILFVAVCGCGACTRHPEQTDTPPKQDGIYAVLREATTSKEAREGDAGCIVLPYDQKYTGAGPSDAIRYVAIDPASFVPMILEGAPEATKAGDGKTILSVTLNKEYVKPLEDFTRKQLNGKIAILLDGEIVTLHKIRAVISEGKFQATRCTDNACEILRAKLTE